MNRSHLINAGEQRTTIMLRQATNLVSQTVLSTVLSTLKPINVVCKITLEATAGISAGVHVAKDATRRKLVPNHPINKATNPLSFNDALRDIHDIRTIEMRVLDKRVSIEAYKKEMGIVPVKDLFAKFTVKQPVTQEA